MPQFRAHSLGIGRDYGFGFGQIGNAREVSGRFVCVGSVCLCLTMQIS